MRHLLELKTRPSFRPVKLAQVCLWIIIFKLRNPSQKMIVRSS